MAASIYDLTPDVIRAAARHTAAAVNSGTPRGAQRQPLQVGTPGNGYAQDRSNARATPTVPFVPPIRNLDGGGAFVGQHEEQQEPGGNAFWEACERAHDMYNRTVSAGTSQKSSSPASPSFSQGRSTSPKPPSARGADNTSHGRHAAFQAAGNWVSPGKPQSQLSSAAASPHQTTFDTEGMSVFHMPPNDDAYENGAEAYMTEFQVQAGGVPAAKHSSQPTAKRGPERFFYDASTYTGTYAHNTAPKSKPSTGRKMNSISVDELVERLYQANDKYTQRRMSKQEDKAKAEVADITHTPRLNRNSIILAGGVESLEARRDKITQRKAERLDKARARQEEVDDAEVTGQPLITSKAARIHRNYEALTRWEDHKQQKLMHKQQMRDQERLQECTFQPNLCHQSKKITQRRDETSCSDGIFTAVHSRLHDDARRRRHEREANEEPGYAESKPGSSTSSTFRRGDVSSFTAQPRNRSTPAGAGKHTSASAAGPGSSVSKPLSFDAFMRSLAAENAAKGVQVPGWSADMEAPDERELVADSALVVDMPNGLDRYSRQSRNTSASNTPRGTPRMMGRSALIADAEDEIFMAEAPPRPSPYPSARSSPGCLSEGALPEWVKFAVPAPPPVPHMAAGSVASTTVNSGRSTPRQAGWSQKGRSVDGSQVSQKESNVMTYTGMFHDVFRIGYGGALPGTLET